MHGPLSFLLRGEKNPLVNQPNTSRAASGNQNGVTRIRMRHTLRSPITGRFIAKRSTGTELVENHNRETRKRRLWDLLDAVGAAVLFGAVGFTLVIALALVWGVVK